MNMGGFATVVQFAKLGVDKVRTGISLPMTMEGDGVGKCEMTDGLLRLRVFAGGCR